MKKIPVVLVTGTILFMLSSCGQTRDTEDIAGSYVCPIDDSTLSIVDAVDGSYRAAVDLFRLTGIDDFTGKYENGTLTMTGTDVSGNPITSEITFSDGQATLTFTDSTWKYLENGTQYVFHKQIDAQTDENADVKMTAEEPDMQ